MIAESESVKAKVGTTMGDSKNKALQSDELLDTYHWWIDLA